MTRRIQTQEALKLALSMVLFYALALWMDWNLPKYGALAIVLISLGTTGASLQKGVLRIAGTTTGLGFGLLALAWFAQDRWLTLLFHAGYLAVIAYFMTGSRNAYAWFVAGFLPSLVWSSTYMKVDSAFHYAVFRYLETTAGVIIYTTVSALLWPRRAGDQLDAQGADLWAGVRDLLALGRRQLAEGQAAVELSALRTRLAGIAAKMAATQQAAYADTPSVNAQRSLWEVLRLNVRALGDALDLWCESLADCRRLELERLLPRLVAGLDTLEGRLARVDDLWKTRRGGPAEEDDDRALLEPLGMKVDQEAHAELPHFDRAAVMSFAQQLEALDVTSRELLRTLRALSGLDPSRRFRPQSLPPDLYRPVRWSPQRLVKAVFPPLCFATAYLTWILINPPGGAGLVSFAAIISLLVLLSWMNPLSLVVVFLGALALAVAPIYFFVMPHLESGLGLLSLIFAYSFLFRYLGGRWPVLKTIPLVLFVMMTGISNQQTYSFIGLVDGGLMLALGLTAVGVVQMLLSPMRPEKILLHGLRRFFGGCARIVGAFALDGRAAPARLRELRRHCYQSMVLPVPQRLQAVAKNLDFEASPEDSPEQMQGFLTTLPSISHRLQALELAHAQLVHGGHESAGPMSSLGGQLRDLVQHEFESWARLERPESMDVAAARQRLSRDLQEKLDDVAEGGPRGPVDDRTLSGLYTMLGCARGLIQAMAETTRAMASVHWDRWVQARF